MSRGRPPRMACKEACTSAAQRGVVLDAPGMETSRIDFILFIRQRVTFIRVKRSHSRICSPGELTSRFSSEIAGLRNVPLTPVVSREIWVFLPWGTWQYFCIGNGTVTEIHDDTGKIPGIQPDPVLVLDQRDPVPAGAVAEGACPSTPEITYPIIPSSRG